MMATQPLMMAAPLHASWRSVVMALCRATQAAPKPVTMATQKMVTLARTTAHSMTTTLPVATAPQDNLMISLAAAAPQVLLRRVRILFRTVMKLAWTVVALAPRPAPAAQTAPRMVMRRVRTVVGRAQPLASLALMSSRTVMRRILTAVAHA